MKSVLTEVSNRLVTKYELSGVLCRSGLSSCLPHNPTMPHQPQKQHVALISYDHTHQLLYPAPKQDVSSFMP